MKRDPMLGFLLFVAGALFTIAIVTLINACGGAAAQHRALNALAETADPSYELAAEACDEAEGAIIARAGTTYEQDREAIASIRSVCDRIFAGFETVRLAHRAARAAVDGGGGALLGEALSSLGDAWLAAQRLLPELAGIRGEP